MHGLLGDNGPVDSSYSISNPNVCEIIPFKNTTLFGSTEVELQISTPSPKGKQVLLLFKPGDDQQLLGPCHIAIVIVTTAANIHTVCDVTGTVLSISHELIS